MLIAESQHVVSVIAIALLLFVFSNEATKPAADACSDTQAEWVCRKVSLSFQSASSLSLNIPLSPDTW